MLLRRYKDRQIKKPEGATFQEDVAPSSAVALEDMNVEELKAYAEEHGIDIGKATSQEGILKKIQEANLETE
jgi:hypothetical protein